MASWSSQTSHITGQSIAASCADVKQSCAYGDNSGLYLVVEALSWEAAVVIDNLLKYALTMRTGASASSSYYSRLSETGKEPMAKQSNNVQHCLQFLWQRQESKKEVI